MKKIIIIFSILLFIKHLYADNYAFLISAGKTLMDDQLYHSEYWYDLFLSYEDLIIEEGYTHDNVIVFYGDGNDWEDTQYNRYKKSLHGWQNDIVDYENSYKKMNDIFKYYGEHVITGNDNLLIRWVAGHGSSTNCDDYEALIENQNDEITEQEIITMINQIDNYNRRKFLWMTCRSGCLALGNYRLNDNDNSIIITCADCENGCNSFITQNGRPHAEFNYIVTSSLYGEDPLGDSYDGDHNDDNVINFNDLFVEADVSPIMNSDPLIGDDCPMADFLFIDEELELENSQLDDILSYRVDKIYASNNLTVASNGDVTFAADKEITLGPGFISQHGSEFRAYIGYIDCYPGGIVYNPTSNNEIFNNRDHCYLKISPNPSNGLLKINYKLREGKKTVKIVVKDILGVNLKELVNIKDHPSGCFNTSFNVKDLSQGSYYISLIMPKEIITKQFVVIK